MGSSGNNNGPAWSIVALVVGVLAIVAALILGIEATPRGLDSNSTPLVTTMLGMAGTMITAVFAAWRSDQAHRTSQSVKQDTEDIKNGALTEKMKSAVREVQQENGGSNG